MPSIAATAASRSDASLPSQRSVAAGAPTPAKLRRIDSQVDRVVVREQQVAHDLGRAAGARRVLPGVDDARGRAARAARRGGRRTRRRRRRRSRSRASSSATRARAAARASRQGDARMRAISASGTRRSPIFLLSLSTNTGRDGSSRRSASQTSVSNAFCDGCALPGTRPSTEPRWLASAFEVEHLRAARGERVAAGGSCPSRSGRRRRGTSKPRRQRLERGDDGAAEVAVAAFEHVDAKADLVEHESRARRCACRRASSRRAASSRAACRARGARCARRRCARPARRRASSPRTARPACTRCRPRRARRRSATAS